MSSKVSVSRADTSLESESELIHSIDTLFISNSKPFEWVSSYSKHWLDTGYSGSYSVYHTKLNTSPKFSCDVIDSFLLNSDLLEQKINILKSSGYNTEV